MKQRTEESGRATVVRNGFPRRRKGPAEEADGPEIKLKCGALRRWEVLFCPWGNAANTAQEVSPLEAAHSAEGERKL